MPRSRVILESPLAGDIRNKAYARVCMRDSMLRHGEDPYASHLLYDQPGILDDTIPEERELGIAAGFNWHTGAERTVVYVDLGISDGMLRGISRADSVSRPVDHRWLPAALWLPFGAPEPARTAAGLLVHEADRAALREWCARFVEARHGR